jgi:hypothetical protein
MIRILVFLSLCIVALDALSFEKSEVFKNIEPRLRKGPHSKVFDKKENYYHYSYKTELPRRSRKIVWTSDEVMFFSNDRGRISQLALISYRCGIDTSLENQRLLKNQARKLFINEGKALFGERVEITDEEIKLLGPELRKIVRLNLKRTVSGVKRPRLSRGLYKCDGMSGYGYRLDFFF